jgi:sodium-independent sulfate anion transporter 11
VIIFLTLAAYLHLRHKTVKQHDLSVLKTVPAGFKHMGTPVIDRKLLWQRGPSLGPHPQS